MGKFGKTDQDKLCAYLQEKFREMTGDQTITVSYNRSTPAEESSAESYYAYPKLEHFKVEFAKGTWIDNVHVEGGLPPAVELKRIFAQPDAHSSDDETQMMVDAFKKNPVQQLAQIAKDEAPGRLSIEVVCSNITIAKHLAETNDAEIFKRAMTRREK